MRVPVVIALVLAGVVALFLALGQGGGPTGGSAEPARPEAAAPTSSRTSAPDRAQPVKAVDSAGQVTRTETAVVPQREERDEVVADGVWATAIEGVVVDESGNPIPEAIVALRDDNAFGAAGNLAPFLQLAGGVTKEPEVWSIATNEQGEFSFPGVKPGEGYTVLASAEGFAPKEVQRISVEEGQTSRERIVLDKGFSISGYVRDVETAVLLAKVRMVLIPLTFAQFPEDTPQYQSNVKTIETDDQGYYVFPNVAPQMYVLSAHLAGYGSVTLNDVMVTHERGRKTITRDFNLEPGAGIAGYAYSRTGTPLEGVRITALSLGGQKTSRGSALTDARGAFELPDLVPGTYTVVGQLAGWDEGREQRVETGTLDLRLELTQQGGVEGRVLSPEGAPLADFSVALRMVNPHTNSPGRAVRETKFKGAADGAFVIGGFPEGDYVIEAKAKSYAPTFSARFKIAREQVARGIEIRMNYGGSLTGVVVDAATGAPVVGAQVKTYDNGRTQTPLEGLLGLLAPRTTTERTARTDEDGRFLLDLLSPDVYQVEVTHRDYYAVIQKDLRVLASAEPTDAGRFTMSPGATLVGTVYDQAGAPLAGGKVTLTGNPQAIGLTYEGRTDTQGRYRIENVLPGTYQVHAQRPGGSAGGNPFDVLVDIQNSKASVFLREGREQVQDLSLGG
jgi:protocatechuate 3,4-dioxygenase beta subunit